MKGSACVFDNSVSVVKPRSLFMGQIYQSFQKWLHLNFSPPETHTPLLPYLKPLCQWTSSIVPTRALQRFLYLENLFFFLSFFFGFVLFPKSINIQGEIERVAGANKRTASGENRLLAESPSWGRAGDNAPWDSQAQDTTEASYFCLARSQATAAARTD